MKKGQGKKQRKITKEMYLEAYDKGKSFAELLEEIDPSRKDDKLDAFERQLEKFGIKVNPETHKGDMFIGEPPSEETQKGRRLALDYIRKPIMEKKIQAIPKIEKRSEEFWNAFFDELRWSRSLIIKQLCEREEDQDLVKGLMMMPVTVFFALPILIEQDKKTKNEFGNFWARLKKYYGLKEEK